MPLDWPQCWQLPHGQIKPTAHSLTEEVLQQSTAHTSGASSHTTPIIQHQGQEVPNENLHYTLIETTKRAKVLLSTCCCTLETLLGQLQTLPKEQLLAWGLQQITVDTHPTPAGYQCFHWCCCHTQLGPPQMYVQQNHQFACTLS
jgi:hypothetical protein